MNDAILSKRSGPSSLRVDVLFAGAIDGDLDGNLATFNLLTIHLTDSLLLQFLGAERDESKSTTLTGFATSLELLDHIALNWAKGDLGGSRAVSREKFLELHNEHQQGIVTINIGCNVTFSSLRS